jgi:hypothetical protein
MDKAPLAIIVPRIVEDAPIETAPLTNQNTLLALAPFVKVTALAAPPVKAPPILKTK